MSLQSDRDFFEKALLEADIQINGSRPWDIQVHDPRVFRRVVGEGTLGLGESYMDGWWDCEQLDEFFSRVLRSRLYERIPYTLPTILTKLQWKFSNLQTKTRAKKVAEVHYNLGNDFYQAMLDPYMQYSCAYFKDTTDLAVAEKQKLDLICRKLQLTKDDHLLDIGCGWGGLAKFAAENYGCKVTGVTIAEEQVKLAREMCKGLPIEILQKDYRDVEGTFSKIVSVGMFEHVGYKNYKEFFEVARKNLKDDGLFLLHTIGSYLTAPAGDPWLTKYIFPNSMLPSMQQIAHPIEKLFTVEDWHNFGAYYDKTLMAWRENFEKHWGQFKDHYGERFYRMWIYYLMSCAGMFRARDAELWQIVLSPKGVLGGYTSVR